MNHNNYILKYFGYTNNNNSKFILLDMMQNYFVCKPQFIDNLDVTYSHYH